MSASTKGANPTGSLQPEALWGPTVGPAFGRCDAERVRNDASRAGVCQIVCQRSRRHRLRRLGRPAITMRDTDPLNAIVRRGIYNKPRTISQNEKSGLQVDLDVLFSPGST